jgi:5-formyltetrahydrofolate cyclo-ligase
MEKAQAREEIARRLDALTPEQRREASARIRRLVADLPEFQRATTVLLFVSLPDEVDTLPIIADALAAGKIVAVPKVDRRRKVMDACEIQGQTTNFPSCSPASPPLGSASALQSGFPSRPEAEIRSLSLNLAPGAFGILEPREAVVVEPSAIDFVLVPARGYDRSGNRIGRGGGYYDRYMAQPAFRAVRCGVAFAAQVLDSIPHTPHDLPVELLVTERSIVSCRQVSQRGRSALDKTEPQS